MKTTLHITGLSHDGSGVGRDDDGKVVLYPEHFRMKPLA